MMSENKYQSPRRGTDLSDSAAHSADHRSWSRRGFMKMLGLAGAANVTAGMLPVTSLFAAPLTAALGEGGDRKLVLIRLKGGNDGLNTFVPLYQFDTYQNARPTLAHAQADLLNLNSEFAMPTVMQDLEPLWMQGKMRVINSVGYPNHNLSHFTGSDIIASGSADTTENSNGWPARYFVNQNPDYITDPCPFPPAVKIGGPSVVLFNDENGLDLSANFANTQQLNSFLESGSLYDNINAPNDCYNGEQVLFLRTVANAASLYGTAIFDAYNSSETQADYGSNTTGLAEQLKLTARLIKGGLETQFYLVTLDGFDTHVSQNGFGNGGHLALLEEVSSAVKAFYEDLAAGDKDKDVLSMTFSEFGRRVEENGFSGTDHGTAMPVMLFGSALEGNDFHGTPPDLTELDAAGNLQFGTDFRSIYATILEHWLCLDADVTDEILGAEYERLDDLGFACTSTPIFDVPAPQLTHRMATLGGGAYNLLLHLPTAGRVRLDIFTADGIRLGTFADGEYPAGPNTLPISLAQLPVEQIPLVYVLDYNGRRSSGKFIGGKL